MDIMRSMRLHKIRETARASDTSHSGDLLVVNIPLLDQLVVDCEYGEITAAGAPRRVIGGYLFLG